MIERLEQLQVWMKVKEDEHFEFKEAKRNFHFEKLVDYCVALANERGGKMILGVTDKRPRRVVGSRAFENLERTKAGLIDRLHLRIEAEVIPHQDGRVVVFHVPSRPLGIPIHYGGRYLMRGGEDLVSMTQDQLKRIFEEAGPDFSAEICPGTTMADLDPAAIEWLRAGWLRKSNNDALSHLTHEQLLEDAELTVDGCVTYAALILLGTHRSLGRHLAQSEVIFEYRSSEASIPAQQRVEHRRGALLFLDEVWQTINLRNDVQQVRDGLFVWDIRTFNEDAAREAILNAVSHRDYRLGGSVFVRQFPRKLEIVSPGGFPSGITPENILWRQLPRNRRIAEVFAKCGLVERSGQGANTMFEEAIKESKPRPDFSGTDDYQVSLTLHGEIQDPRFLRFLDKVGKDRVSRFTTHDLLILDLVHRELPIVESLKPRLAVLVREGIVESVGRGRGTRYLPSAQFYGFLGEKGTYTRRRGLGREANKALLLKHIRDNRREGSQLKELTQVLPFLSRYQVQELLRDLKAEGQIYNLGHTRTSRWHPTATPSDAAQTEQG